MENHVFEASLVGGGPGRVGLAVDCEEVGGNVEFIGAGGNFGCMGVGTNGELTGLVESLGEVVLSRRRFGQRAQIIEADASGAIGGLLV